ncbi:hypothetical protein [Paraburkholderia caballeronis]|uniref:hypothetical protein n=1 Tax=Paraburkholderia caballeronis TaxID=416943 RepID=UPI0010657622|nr:hypothetical protein [Paraburkholderia caballeronis]TDV13865.1 hypothetical protein C7408_10935 [Paraburkholderia caballeronis]TDV15379.1 hypothetical protein C7406_11035 [Paraburkholderia caballeronis]TDV24846.1 hypothetical protein C7404_10935 [Paraburkholderia caballeronis]TDV38945.1 hypothetical protein C7405_10162 [Paraburkholderia caballeronis]
MVTASNPPFDACRANACAALQMMSASQQWNEHWLALQQHRFERDRDALRGTFEALRDAKDWNDFAAGSQAVWRDYLSTSATIWQEGVAAAMQGAGAWSDTAREAMQQWQDSVSGLQQGAAGGAALPMREWMAAFERAVSAASAMHPADAAAAKGAATHARDSRPRGAHHVG